MTNENGTPGLFDDRDFGRQFNVKLVQRDGRFEHGRSTVHHVTVVGVAPNGVEYTVRGENEAAARQRVPEAFACASASPAKSEHQHPRAVHKVRAIVAAAYELSEAADRSPSEPARYENALDGLATALSLPDPGWIESLPTHLGVYWVRLRDNNGRRPAREIAERIEGGFWKFNAADPMTISDSAVRASFDVWPVPIEPPPV